MKRLMPYGLANFEKIATENYCYVDKTMFIQRLEKTEFPIFLRPRRFGKSLFTETLRCDYDIKLKERFQEIFGKLYIGFNKLKNFEYEGSKITPWIPAYIRKSDVNELIAGFFREIIQKYPGNFFSNVNESFYHGLLYHVLENHTRKDDFQVLPEYNLPNGRADIMLKTYPNTRAPMQIHYLFEEKRVPKDATEEQLKQKLVEAVQQLKQYKTSEYEQWRGIAVCFRGNLDFLMEMV